MIKRHKAEVEFMVPHALPLGGAGDGAAETLTSTVRHALRRDVLTLALPPGARLSIRDLRLRYDVGATPIREALWSLLGEGLVVVEPQMGFRVAEADRDRLVGLMLLRQRMEPWLLGKALELGGPAWLRSVERAYAEFEPLDSKVGDLRPIDERWETLHRAFHISLVEGSGVPTLVQAVAHWYAETDRYRRLASPNLGATVGAKGDHDELCELVMAGAAAEAVAVLERHIRDTAERHLDYFDAGGVGDG
ncbi:hypothetical protein N825_23195 [Skermanella stibiiresistens SB22]|uniref:HTH gntR-type domain-containing protein n=2 Tax=Skermanella TaxID=204447 RepID=W9GSM9_9PROT|nr:hypothetical protein N825_23195 [Skermanella stibiiresistens SB22]